MANGVALRTLKRALAINILMLIFLLFPYFSDLVGYITFPLQLRAFYYGIVLVAYFVFLTSLFVGNKQDKLNKKYAKVRKEIDDYLNLTNRDTVSFERLRRDLNPEWTDEYLQEVLNSSNNELRYADVIDFNTRGKKPGLSNFAKSPK